jgi:hypothetical protein
MTVGYERPASVVRQNADKRTRPQVHGDEVHSRRVLDGDSFASDTESRSYAG